MITFAAYCGVLQAQATLADAYFRGNIEGIPKSLERAKYWYGKVVHCAYFDISRHNIFEVHGCHGAFLLSLPTQNVNGVVDVAGHSSVPEALHWFGKAARFKS